MTIRLIPAMLTVAVAAMLAGCGTARGPYAPDGSLQRDEVRAAKLYQSANAILVSDPKQAEALLREALGYDLYLGPAHNNLGVLLLKQDHLYDAAEEFEWARKLMPGNPEPRVNLAIALERGGKHQDALDAAHAALETTPGNLAAIQTIAYIQIREGLADGQTKAHLDAIISRSADQRWRDWAQRWRISLDGHPAVSAP
jgi:tetratricopeptide (TPR) repeat protein